ncbi:MAG: response regulator transcription factor [Elusimicrobiota bacterium]
MRIFIATARPAQAARWQRVTGFLGLRCVRADGLRALEREACRRGQGQDFALIDWRLLSGGAQAALKGLREHAPGVSVIVFAEEEALLGPAVAKALGAGAMDFFPSSAPDEVLADKLFVHLKRTCPGLSLPGVLESGGLRVDVRRWEVLVRQARGRWKALEGLTPKEFELLRLFLENPGRPLDRSQLMDGVWGERSDDVNPEVVDKQVGSLRRKLGPQGKRIRTLRGVGYTLADS